MVLVGESGVGKSSLIQQFTQVSDTNTDTDHRHRHRSQITDHRSQIIDTDTDHRSQTQTYKGNRYWSTLFVHFGNLPDLYFFVTLPHCNYFVISTVCSGCISAGPTCNNRSVQTLYFLAYFPPCWRNLLFVQLCKLHFNIGRKLNFTFARSWVCPAWDGGRGKEGELFGLQWLVTWKPCEKLPPLNWKDTVAKS